MKLSPASLLLQGLLDIGIEGDVMNKIKELYTEDFINLVMKENN